jgi:hypothetical protein
MGAWFSKPVRLFCQDESRFGLLPQVRRRLTAYGVRPVHSVLPRYEWYWLYGAVEPETGASFFLEMPGLDGTCFQVYLDAFSAAFPETMNIVLLDSAPAHIWGSLQVPENVQLVFFPSYSPELNPIERFWQDLKADLDFGVVASLSALKDEVAARLCAYSDAALAQLTGYRYLAEAANALST